MGRWFQRSSNSRSLPRTSSQGERRMKMMRKVKEKESEEEEDEERTPVRRPKHLPLELTITPPRANQDGSTSSPVIIIDGTKITFSEIGASPPDQRNQGMIKHLSQREPREDLKMKKMGEEEEEAKKEREEQERSRGASSSGQTTTQSQDIGSAEVQEQIPPMPRRKESMNMTPPIQPLPEADQLPVVLTTKYGKAHHRRMTCGYLKAPGTREIRRSSWCMPSKCSAGSRCSNYTMGTKLGWQHTLQSIVLRAWH